MKINPELLNENLQYLLDVTDHGECQYSHDEDSQCDHDYNRCYIITSISIAEPTDSVYSYLADCFVPNCPPMVKEQVISILKNAQSTFDFTDTANFDWTAESDYYGENIKYVRLNSQVQEFLIKQLEQINE